MRGAEGSMGTSAGWVSVTLTLGTAPSAGVSISSIRDPSSVAVALAMRAARSASVSVALNSIRTVSAGLLTEIISRSSRGVRSSCRSLRTGRTTSGLLMSGAYDLTRCTANWEFWKLSGLVGSEAVTSTNDVAVAVYLTVAR